ncbi:MAG: hypothetical protein H6566_26745 [Lewinellaceae bacterium]|nr:hypothetical protein [Lewinellaceae bacterium]
MKFRAIILILLIWSCQDKSPKKNPVEEIEMEKQSLMRPKQVSSGAKLINLGFVDAPVYVWVEYIGNYAQGGKVYPHIYGLKHTYADGSRVDTTYYEHSLGRTDNTAVPALTGFDFIPYPGDATYKFSKGDESFLLFNVLTPAAIREKINGREYIMSVPTTRINAKGEKVSGEGVHLSIENDNGDLYSVSTPLDILKNQAIFTLGDFPQITGELDQI